MVFVYVDRSVFYYSDPQYLDGACQTKGYPVVSADLGISLVLPYVKMAAPLLGYTGNYGNMGLLGECDWNIYGMFYYMSGFVGYLVLAYYLVKYPLTWSWKRTLGITLPMFLIGYTVTSLGFVLTQKYFPGSYANLEIIWYFSGIQCVYDDISRICYCTKAQCAFCSLVVRLASLTFGIYLCHFVFVQVAYDLLGTVSGLPVIVRILGMACLAFGIQLVACMGNEGVFVDPPARYVNDL